LILKVNTASQNHYINSQIYISDLTWKSNQKSERCCTNAEARVCDNRALESGVVRDHVQF